VKRGRVRRFSRRSSRFPRLARGAVPLSRFFRRQVSETLQVVRQVSQSDLTSRSHAADRSHDRPTERRLMLRAEHVLDAHSHLAFLPIRLLLFLRERTVSRALPDQLRTIAELSKRRLRLLRYVSRVGVNVLVRVAVVEQFLEHLTVMDRRIGRLVIADELMLGVDGDVVFVTEIRIPVFLRPASVRVLLSAFVRSPQLGRLAVFDAVVFVVRVPLTRDLDEARIDDLSFFRLEARFAKMLVEQGEQIAFEFRLGHRVLEDPDRVGVGDAVAEREPEEPHERDAVEDLEFGLIERQIVKRPEDRDFEHQNGVVRRTTGFSFLTRRTDRFEQRSKHIPIDGLIESHERIARFAESVESELPIEKSCLFRHVSVLAVTRVNFRPMKSPLYHVSA